MVYNVNQSVLGIVKTALVVITSVVRVTTDVMMVGLDQTVQKVVRIFIVTKQYEYKRFISNNVYVQIIIGHT